MEVKLKCNFFSQAVVMSVNKYMDKISNWIEDSFVFNDISTFVGYLMPKLFL